VYVPAALGFGAAGTVLIQVEALKPRPETPNPKAKPFIQNPKPETLSPSQI